MVGYLEQFMFMMRLLRRFAPRNDPIGTSLLILSLRALRLVILSAAKNLVLPAQGKLRTAILLNTLLNKRSNFDLGQLFLIFYSRRHTKAVIARPARIVDKG
jgi:hypothetical protein